MASWLAAAWENKLERVNNTLPAQLPAAVETRQFLDDLATMSVANSEDDVTHTICSVALELRNELENGKPTLRKSKTMIVSNRKGLAKRARRILKVNDFHLPVADEARDLGVDAAGGGRSRHKALDQKGSMLQDVWEK